MKRLAVLLFLLSGLATAQVVGGPGFVQYVLVAPSGGCGSTALQQNVQGSGDIWVCHNNTWTKAASGGGGGGVTGSGTTGTIPIWTSSTALGDSHITDDMTGVTVTTAGNFGVLAGNQISLMAPNDANLTSETGSDLAQFSANSEGGDPNAGVDAENGTDTAQVVASAADGITVKHDNGVTNASLALSDAGESILRLQDATSDQKVDLTTGQVGIQTNSGGTNAVSVNLNISQLNIVATDGTHSGQINVNSINDTIELTALNTAITAPRVPANAGEACEAGTISWDSGFIYVCVATNTWKRGAIITF